ncbi:LuxR C-terminal-related transcriptional regulator [Lysinibacillus boronitolerans]|uniref:LuxR C-terminal-related transcriptional regulator n=1 Tax=Lysinibacillus boronitolerans TaxID=309788 RepID=UPI002867B612|nr:LuxR C-terminal-related transcriptional regulator [Lysinibacillus boronitolerans]
MPNILLASKTTVPQTGKQIIERERLNAILHQSTAKLIVVQAPAGYGKTTLLSSWFQQLETTVAWYTVDQTDNDPIRYWKYLIHAIGHSLQQEASSRIDSILHAQPQLPLEYLVDALLNELSLSTEKVHIMIDDYHHIFNVTIHQMMTRLIDFLPEHCFIYLTSRSTISLPIAKWRLNHCLLEIGMEHLLFTYEEAKEFYENLNKQLKAKELQKVFEITEGWATGLQLTNLAGFHNVDDKEFGESNSNVIHYLMNEVFSKLATPLQTFLLYTSLLEQLTADTCNVLTNRTDAQLVLLELDQQGLFISRVEAKEQVFRYHNLFREALRQELSNRFTQHDILNLYEKAAVALYNNGSFLSAIELALSGNVFIYAEQWIQEHLVTFLSCGHSTSYVNWIDTFLTNGYEVHPELMVMYAYTLAALHNLEDAYQTILDLEQKHRSNQWMNKSEYASAVDDFLGVKAYIFVMKNGDLSQAGEYIQQRLERNPVGSKWDAIFIQYNQTEPMLFRTNIGSRGKLLSDEQAMSFFAKFRTGEFKNLSMTGYSYGMRAEKLYEWNQFDELPIELEEALRSGHQFQDAGLLVPMYILKSKIAVLEEQYIVAQGVLDHAIETVNERYWIDSIRVMKALLFLREDNIIQAKQELAKIEENVYKDSPFYLLVKARYLLMKGHLLEAQQLIIQVQLQAQQQEQLSTRIEATILLAICLAEQEQAEEALRTLHQALKLAEPYNYIRTFLDENKIIPLIRDYIDFRRKRAKDDWDEVTLGYAYRLLDYVQELTPVLEALSAREQEIFSLLSEGASNKEIAEQLFLSEGTIRVYLSGIYNKLGVKNRAQALLLKQSK